MINLSTLLGSAGEIFFGPILQDAPAQTSGYFIAGYAVIFGVMALYLASLIIRSRNLQHDMEVLNQLEEQQH